ncbi:MAG: DUF503 domain-containing protein [Defluviitaleaceae bacterium]|nr:DUF503 domain-containing protein [Defluviitaleaceae bacterium]
MYISSASLTFHIPHASSLKDKRQIARSVIEKTRHKFNASVAEVDDMDNHQRLTIGICLVANNASYSQKCIEQIIRFMEEIANADLVDVQIWQD